MFRLNAPVVIGVKVSHLLTHLFTLTVIMIEAYSFEVSTKVSDVKLVSREPSFSFMQESTEKPLKVYSIITKTHPR